MNLHKLGGNLLLGVTAADANGGAELPTWGATPGFIGPGGAELRGLRVHGEGNAGSNGI